MSRKKSLGPTDRELAILGVLWNKGPCTVREVHEALDQDAQTGYTTTLKLMQIMVEKGLLVREGEESAESSESRATSHGSRPESSGPSRRGHVYRTALSEERTQKDLIQDLLDRVFAGSAAKLVMRALSARKVTPKELKRIREMLDQIEGE
ncbi:MAG: BlaI/MecI/CopY family transcriptional regulator [Solirubrobacterales bacterium]